MLNFGSTMLDPIYAVIGVEAVLTPATSVSAATITAIDKSAGVVLADAKDPAVQTVRPGARVRMAELTANGITLLDLDNATLAMNGKTWTVKAHRPMPNPNGEGEGEVLLLLSENI